MTKNLLPPGFKDDMSEQANLEHKLKNKIIDLFQLNGYELVKPPLIEYANSENVNNVFNQIRAFSPKPGAWFLYQNERIKIISCSKIINKSIASTIINERFHIGCKGGAIAPIIIQREGKKSMEIDDFLRGFQFSIGQIVNA